MSLPARHIVAMGGGGFSEEETPWLDDFILGLCPPHPNVCFLGTAGYDSPHYAQRFLERFSEADCTPHVLRLLPEPEEDPLEVLADQDLIYVGGGNSPKMLETWALHGVDKALRAAWERGAVLAGISAGSMCWFEWGITRGLVPLVLMPLPDCLGFLPGSNCPHYDEPDRRASYLRKIRYGVLPDGYAAEGGAALHFCDEQLVEVVTSRPEAKAFRVEADGDTAVETALPTRFLGTIGAG